MRCISVTGLLLAFFISLLPLADVAGAARLNLLIITADDLNADSWWDSKVATTPGLDAFARESYRIEHCHVTAPICQPSRSALMTGRVPHRNGALGFDPINLDVPTLTEVMSSNGYFTAAMNKLIHMAPESKFNWDLRLDGSGKSPRLLREQFEQCLQKAASNKQPFFINANITDPHRPFAGSGGRESRRGRTRNEQAAAAVPLLQTNEVIVPPIVEDIPPVRTEVAQYFSSVRRMDQSFAGLMAALKAAGRNDDTLIVFLSDNGISLPYAKATLYRCGTWSPVLFHGPGINAFNNTRDMVSSVDIMPTVLELMKVRPPGGMDGRSLVPLLEGGTLPGTDHVFTHVNTVSSGKSYAGRCVRTKTRTYIWNEWPDGETTYKVEAMGGLSFAAMEKASAEHPKIKQRVDFFLYRCSEEFYDLDADPSERHNLFADPRFRAEINGFKQRLLSEMKRTGDPLAGKFEQTIRGEARPGRNSAN